MAKRMEQKRIPKMVNEQLKRYLTSEVTREIQVENHFIITEWL